MISQEPSDWIAELIAQSVSFNRVVNDLMLGSGWDEEWASGEGWPTRPPARNNVVDAIRARRHTQPARRRGERKAGR